MARIGLDPVLLGTVVTTAYTVTAAKQSTLIEINLVNTDTMAGRTPEVYLVPSGQSSQDKYRIIGGDNSKAAEAGAGGNRIVLRFRQFLESGDFIQWKADAANKITGWIGVVEDSEDNTKYRNVDADFLGVALATLLTVAAQKQATLIEMIAHNTDTVARDYTVHLVPDGGAAGDANKIITKESLDPGETIISLWNLHRAAAVTVQAQASVASKVVAKLSVLE